MKKVMNVFSFLAIFFMIVGALFKIMHWPGAGLFLVLSQGFMSFLYLPMLYAYKRKSLNGWKQRFSVGFGIFCLAFFMIAVLAKIMHWPGAGPMFLLSMVMFSLVFVPSHCIQRNRVAASKLEKMANIFLAIPVSLFTLGILFKIMHWPGASIMLIIGSILFVLVFLPLLIMANRSDAGKGAEKLISLYFVVTAICILVSLTISSTSGSVFISFPIIEEGINALTTDIEMKNEISYDYSASNLASADIKTKTETVKQLSDEMYGYIFQLKSFLIATTENMPKELADSVSLFNVNGKDNYDVPTHILIGGDPEKLLEGAFTARELKNKFTVYKMDLMKIVGDSADQQLEKRIGLNTKDAYDSESEQITSWENKMFYHLPLGSVITILSHIQSNVRYAESEVLSSVINTSTEAIQINKGSDKK